MTIFDARDAHDIRTSAPRSRLSAAWRIGDFPQ
jgi:hypothetical protein